MKEILTEFSSLKSAVIDSSSVIYASRAGFLTVLAETIRLFTVREVTGETGIPVPDIQEKEPPVPLQGAYRDTDDKVSALALHLCLPLISEDRKLLMKFNTSGLPFYNSLMMLHFLLYRGKLTVEQHETCHVQLLAAARYAQKVLSFGSLLYMEILKRI